MELTRNTTLFTLRKNRCRTTTVSPPSLDWSHDKCVMFRSKQTSNFQIFSNRVPSFAGLSGKTRGTITPVFSRNDFHLFQNILAKDGTGSEKILKPFRTIFQASEIIGAFMWMLLSDACERMNVQWTRLITAVLAIAQPVTRLPLVPGYDRNSRRESYEEHTLPRVNENHSSE